MGDGFKVVLEDLRGMSSTFLREHGAYEELAAEVAPPAAATGDGGLDETLGAVVQALQLLHASLSSRIEEHGHKLDTAADSYERSDIDNHGLFDDLMGG